MKIYVLPFFVFFIITISQSADTENVDEKSVALYPIQPNSLTPKRTVKRSAYGYGYGYSPYSYGGYYGYGYPYVSYYSSPYRFGYPYYGGLYGGYGGYGYYGW
ncbi:hypothetical protein WA026_009780 [Henosepilachna vigintioctopunctata]|uniref:Uncharacterized protein n=1 Tax=Henosepilachna vigintioctopunctata TaxID=420089 RepID=A0AAW1TL97_9CUCU